MIRFWRIRFNIEFKEVNFFKPIKLKKKKKKEKTSV